jgi:hypothetical protein
MVEKKRRRPQGGAAARVWVAAGLWGNDQRWGSGSPIGAAAWGVGGDGQSLGGGSPKGKRHELGRR